MHVQSSFFPSKDPSIVNSRLSWPVDEKRTTRTTTTTTTTTTSGEDRKSEEEEDDRTGGGVGSHSIARRRRSPPSPRDVVPPSTCASSPIRRFDRRTRTAIRVPPIPRRDYDDERNEDDHEVDDGEICRVDERMLHPDATYEERYGDAYVDGTVKYLYPAGYQSMRPRSGPWRLSVLVFVAFAILDVFVVGHCYDRGVREYYIDGVVDDVYLRDVDDDSLVMETRWCGSRPLYFMWMVSVWITVSSMSYCSIIGYVKVRDFVVANGRSQPPGTYAWEGGGGGGGGRSDYYLALDNAKGGGGCPVPQAAYAAVAASSSSSDAGTTTTASAYSSYQDGICPGRYVPSIYQSDGTPQFWGGHIYRPTQAAVAMTNRP